MIVRFLSLTMRHRALEVLLFSFCSACTFLSFIQFETGRDPFRPLGFAFCVSGNIWPGVSHFWSILAHPSKHFRLFKRKSSISFIHNLRSSQSFSFPISSFREVVAKKEMFEYAKITFKRRPQQAVICFFVLDHQRQRSFSLSLYPFLSSFLSPSLSLSFCSASYRMNQNCQYMGEQSIAQMFSQILKT